MDARCSSCRRTKQILDFYEGLKQCKKCTDRERNYRNTVHGKLLKYKKDAKSRKKSWNLEDEYAKELMVSPCHYCGIIETKLNGIDRVNNDIGYEPGNVVSCCSECNYSKHKRNKEQFIAHAKRITEYQASYEYVQ